MGSGCASLYWHFTRAEQDRLHPSSEGASLALSEVAVVVPGGGLTRVGLTLCISPGFQLPHPGDEPPTMYLTR